MHLIHSTVAFAAKYISWLQLTRKPSWLLLNHYQHLQSLGNGLPSNCQVFVALSPKPQRIMPTFQRLGLDFGLSFTWASKSASLKRRKKCRLVVSLSAATPFTCCSSRCHFFPIEEEKQHFPLMRIILLEITH